LNNTDVGEDIMVKDWIPHPDYDDDSADFDYALLVLESATTQDIELIRLNSDENFPAVGSVARIMGWGLTKNEGEGDENRTDTNIAMEAVVNIISNAECAAYHDDTTIEDFHICTFEQSKAFCDGDSGEIELS
jgi:secreted trypsin-like serine protease